jgi:hypothetical protein
MKEISASTKRSLVGLLLFPQLRPPETYVLKNAGYWDDKNECLTPAGKEVALVVLKTTMRLHGLVP